MEAEDLDVVADVHDRRHLVGSGRARERVHEAGSSEAAAENGVETRLYAHRVLAIVPVKGLDGAKTRLAPRLSADERARLVVEMLDRVLGACAAADAIGGTLLVTPAPGLARDGVDVLVDAGTGHADALALALADPRASGGALVVMGDCPLVTAESLDALAAAARPLALARARDGGVNALALASLNGFRPRFGVPAETTVAAARAAGLEPVVVDDPALALDVDRPEDYELLLASA
jgi:2-phospho-L-lactate guanylyltransferase